MARTVTVDANNLRVPLDAQMDLHAKKKEISMFKSFYIKPHERGMLFYRSQV